YPRALALWASCGAYAGTLILVALALFHAAERAFDTPPARTIGGVVLALPFLFALIHPLTLLDSANLALVRGAPTIASALRQGHASIDRRLLVLRGAFLFASGAIALFGVALRAQLGWSVAAGLGTFCLGQLGALLALALRNLWLAILSNRHET
ncbi:MAG TPA: hypothetical protein VHZ95_18355, partial [Polyangiales bacterium]|nr:hypothetical protein [Polyangiales bacterium]